MRRLRWYDPFLSALNHALSSSGERPNPAENMAEATSLTPQEKKHAAGLMRVNHSGEIAAQALYIGQSLLTRDLNLQETLLHAAKEEKDHLDWCGQRLAELNSHKSYLNPLWYAGSLMIGVCASIAGREWNLGFLAETERQVFQHLENHLQQLPSQDLKSRTILLQMQQDEAKHEHTAYTLGAKTLPLPIQATMQAFSKVMTTVAYYV